MRDTYRCSLTTSGRPNRLCLCPCLAPCPRRAHPGLPEHRAPHAAARPSPPASLAPSLRADESTAHHRGLAVPASCT